MSGQVHPLQLRPASGHALIRQRPLQWLQYRLQVRHLWEGTLVKQASLTLPHCRPSLFHPPGSSCRRCSIEFDRDCDYFAIAGVTKKIKVFEYGTVIQDAVDIHYPVNEMTCNSKIRWAKQTRVTPNTAFLAAGSGSNPGGGGSD